MNPSVTLRVAIVCFAPDLAVVAKTIRFLVRSLNEAHGAGLLQKAELVIVDNGPGGGWEASLRSVVQLAIGESAFIAGRVLSGHGNVGYGVANNIGLLGSSDEFLLVLNPDVLIERSAMIEALMFMNRHLGLGLLASRVTGQDGARQFLCKRFPTIFDLALRGFAPKWLKKIFSQRLATHEMQDLPDDGPSFGVPIVSGCFMFFRGDVFRHVGGFDPRFFMYFEDFDLSLRAGEIAEVAYVPAVKVIHYGGGASRKGWRHIYMFVVSAFSFFRKHGWRWL